MSDLLQLIESNLDAQLELMKLQWEAAELLREYRLSKKHKQNAKKR